MFPLNHLHYDNLNKTKKNKKNNLINTVVEFQTKQYSFMILTYYFLNFIWFEFQSMHTDFKFTEVTKKAKIKLTKCESDSRKWGFVPLSLKIPKNHVCLWEPPKIFILFYNILMLDI